MQPNNSVDYLIQIEEFNEFLLTSPVFSPNYYKDLKEKLLDSSKKIKNPFHSYIREYEMDFQDYVRRIIRKYDKDIEISLNQLREMEGTGEFRYKERHSVYRKMVKYFEYFNDVRLIEFMVSCHPLSGFDIEEFIAYLTFEPKIHHIVTRFVEGTINSKYLIKQILFELDYSSQLSTINQEMMRLYNKYRVDREEFTSDNYYEFSYCIELYSRFVNENDGDFNEVLEIILDKEPFEKPKIIDLPIIELGDEPSDREESEKKLTLVAIKAVGVGKMKSLQSQIYRHLEISQKDPLSLSWQKINAYLSNYERDEVTEAGFIALCRLQTDLGLYGFYALWKMVNKYYYDVYYPNKYLMNLFSDTEFIRVFGIRVEGLYRQDTSTDKDKDLYTNIFIQLKVRYQSLNGIRKINAIFICTCIAYLVLEYDEFLSITSNALSDLGLEESHLVTRSNMKKNYQEFVKEMTMEFAKFKHN